MTSADPDAIAELDEAISDYVTADDPDTSELAAAIRDYAAPIGAWVLVVVGPDEHDTPAVVTLDGQRRYTTHGLLLDAVRLTEINTKEQS